jgi:hypothetical protein
VILQLSLSIYKYTYIHIYTHICIVDIHVNVYVYKYTRMYITESLALDISCIHKYIYVCRQDYLYILNMKSINSNVYAYVEIHVNSYVYKYTRMYIIETRV